MTPYTKGEKLFGLGVLAAGLAALAGALALLAERWGEVWAVMSGGGV